MSIDGELRLLLAFYPDFTARVDALRLFAYIGLAFLGACAKVGRPQGGPVDETAPTIISHSPAADATRVAADTRVEILFSEPMDRQRTVEACFVAPETPTELKWPGFSGRQLVLEFIRPLQQDRTYVITVGTGARDLRNNPMTASYTFAFGTGEKLNQSTVSGFVFKNHQPAKGAMIWAYDADDIDDTVGHALPAYRTQSGQDGGYQFLRLSAGGYRIIAFEDENRNFKLDDQEYFAAPSVDLLVKEEEETITGDLALYRMSTPDLRLVKVQSLDRNRLLMVFSADVEASDLEFRLSDLEIASVYNLPTDKRKVYLVTAAQKTGKSYRLKRVTWQGHELYWDESIRGSGREDRKSPEIVRSYLSPGQILDDEPLRLVMNEAVEAGDLEKFWIASDSTDTAMGRWERDASTSFSFYPYVSWKAGKHLLYGRPDLLADLAGNSAEDSVYVYEFDVLERSDLTTVRGKVSCVNPRNEAQDATTDSLRVNRMDGGEAMAATRGTCSAYITVVAVCQELNREYTTVPSADGRFELTNLLPCDYVVYSFIDANGNGRHDGGVSQPYRSAEPYDRFPETVSLGRGDIINEVDMELRRWR